MTGLPAIYTNPFRPNLETPFPEFDLANTRVFTVTGTRFLIDLATPDRPIKRRYTLVDPDLKLACALPQNGNQLFLDHPQWRSSLFLPETGSDDGDPQNHLSEIGLLPFSELHYLRTRFRSENDAYEKGVGQSFRFTEAALAMASGHIIWQPLYNLGMASADILQLIKSEYRYRPLVLSAHHFRGPHFARTSDTIDYAEFNTDVGLFMSRILTRSTTGYFDDSRQPILASFAKGSRRVVVLPTALYRVDDANKNQNKIIDLPLDLEIFVPGDQKPIHWHVDTSSELLHAIQNDSFDSKEQRSLLAFLKDDASLSSFLTKACELPPGHKDGSLMITLGDLKRSIDLPLFLSIANDPKEDFHIRLIAAKQVQKQDDPALNAKFFGKITTTDAKDRCVALTCFGKATTEDQIKTLIDLYNKETDTTCQIEIADVLMRSGLKSGHDFLRETLLNPHTHQDAMAFLSAMIDEIQSSEDISKKSVSIEDDVLKRLINEDPQIVTQAIEESADHKSEKIIQRLAFFVNRRQSTRDSNVEVFRTKAIKSLGQIGSPDAITILMNFDSKKTFFRGKNFRSIAITVARRDEMKTKYAIAMALLNTGKRNALLWVLQKMKEKAITTSSQRERRAFMMLLADKLKAYTTNDVFDLIEEALT